MNRRGVTIVLSFMIVLYSCGFRGKAPKAVQDRDPDTIFPRGDIIASGNFTGTAFLQMLVPADTVYNTQIGNVTFQPGARSHWHFHPGGQILLVTHGKGYYQEKGKPRLIIRSGDVIKCPPNVVHWHGASSDSSLTHIAISPNTPKGAVVWLQPVTDKEYYGGIRE